MKIISWNVNGLRSVQKKGFTESIKKLNPDILCIQESRISDSHFLEDWSNLEGYKEFYSCAEKKGYSGVITYVKNSIMEKDSPKERFIKNDLIIKEGRLVLLEFKNFFLYNMYFPSGTTGDIRQDIKYEFLETFLKHLKKTSKERRAKTIISGDVNICHREIDIHHPKVAEKRELSGFLKEERAYIDKYLKLGFKDSFRYINSDISGKYSWWSYRANSRAKNLGWRIDYFFTGEEITKKLKDAKIHSDILGSDHAPISINF